MQSSFLLRAYDFATRSHRQEPFQSRLTLRWCSPSLSVAVAVAGPGEQAPLPAPEAVEALAVSLWAGSRRQRVARSVLVEPRTLQVEPVATANLLSAVAQRESDREASRQVAQDR